LHLNVCHNNARKGHCGTSATCYHNDRGSHGTHTRAVTRDGHGHIARSHRAKDEFKREHPCPSTGATSESCPGYVIDHGRALCAGGKDAPVNMQWQTVSEAGAKDKVECK
jgi:hypothetical protein